MGTSDIEWGTVLVVDVYDAYSQRLKLQRVTMEAIEGPGAYRLLWGTQPSDSEAALSFGDGTISIVSKNEGASTDIIRSFDRSDAWEDFLPDDDGSHFLTVALNKTRGTGDQYVPMIVHHVLLPELFAPKSLTTERWTRLANVKKTMDNRLALTLLASSGDLGFRMRIQELSVKKFRSLHLEELWQTDGALKTGDVLRNAGRAASSADSIEALFRAIGSAAT